MEEIEVSVFARLTQTQQNQIVAEAVYCCGTIDYAAKRREGFHGVFCIVVVPRNVVEIQKREHRIAVLLQPLDDFSRWFSRAKAAAQTLVETVHKDSVLSEKSFL